MITPESAPKCLASLVDSIKHNAACYDRVAECAQAYQGRQARSRHYQGDLLVDIPCAGQWLWSAFIDAVQRTAGSVPVTQEHLAELADRVTGIAANARVMIAYLSDQFMAEQPLNSLIGDLDGLRVMFQ